MRMRVVTGLAGRLAVAFSVAGPVLALTAVFAAAAGSPTPPTVSTSITSNVTESSATLYGYVNPNGQATSYAFQYGTSTSYGKQTSLAPAGSGTTSIRFDEGISGLAAHTTYHYRIIATSSAGNSEGQDQTFTTPAAPVKPPPPRPKPLAPAVSTGGSSGVSYSTATLYGYVDPRGQDTDYAFQYGTSAAYGSQTPLAAAGSGNSSARVSQGVVGLRPFTLYHYRIIAISSAGRALGSDHTFKTKKIPLSLAIVGSPNPVVFGSPFTVEGTLSGTGGAGQKVVLQEDLFPFTAGFADLGNPEVTNSLGGFSFPVVGLGETAQLRVMTLGKPSILSPVLTENVAVNVTFHARRTHRRGVWRLYGTVSPAVPGAIVGFQRLRPGHRSQNIGGTVVKAGTPTVSNFSHRVRIRHRGLYEALVRVSNGAQVSNYSLPIRIR